MEGAIFVCWTHKDVVDEGLSNISFLLLILLQYIGQLWTLDDVFESNGISICTNRMLLYYFYAYKTKLLYRNWVIDIIRDNNLNEQVSLVY